MKMKDILFSLPTVMLVLTYEAIYAEPILKVTPLSNIGRNTSVVFSGGNLWLHLASVAATAVLVQSGADYRVHRYFSDNQHWSAPADPAMIIGYVAPVAVGGGLYAFAKWRHDDELLTAGCAVLQATLISVSVNAVLKAVTGRPNPDPEQFNDMKNASHQFRFGFLRGGIHQGWPSGHTTSTTAIVTALSACYPDKPLLKLIQYLTAGYMLYGVSAHGGGTMHWTSDAAAGTLMGFAIGTTVGSYFHERTLKKDGNIGIGVSPLRLSSGTLLTIRLNF